MKANNRGFTMVELLAVIIIMGIMMVLGLSIFTNTINKSRKKEYVSAALKSVSRAEYMMRANNSTIEKPDNGNAIVFNLKYLKDDSFSTAPYGGEYDFEKSFVVVKNDDEDLKYYVKLVEKRSGESYYGIALTLVDDVQADDIKTVDSIDSDDLYEVNVSTSSDLADLKNKINAELAEAVINEIENSYCES